MPRGAGLRWRPLHTKYAEAPTEPAGETKSFCPCQNQVSGSLAKKASGDFLVKVKNF